MDKLGLLPAIFSVPQAERQRVGAESGHAGVLLMQEALQLLQSWQPQVDPGASMHPLYTLPVSLCP